MKKHHRFLAALILGVVLGALLHPFANHSMWQNLNQHVLYPIGQIFLRLIFMVVVPLVFSALVLGVYELGQAISSPMVA